MFEMISQDFVDAQSHIHYINWNTTNPLFKEYGNNVIDIDAGTEDQPWRYEQANIICPRYINHYITTFFFIIMEYRHGR